jgi:hypothetical protein
MIAYFRYFLLDNWLELYKVWNEESAAHREQINLFVLGCLVKFCWTLLRVIGFIIAVIKKFMEDKTTENIDD